MYSWTMNLGIFSVDPRKIPTDTAGINARGRVSDESNWLKKHKRSAACNTSFSHAMSLSVVMTAPPPPPFFPTPDSCRAWFAKSYPAPRFLVEVKTNTSLMGVKDVDVPIARCAIGSKLLIGLLNTLTGQYKTCGVATISGTPTKTGMFRVKVADCSPFVAEERKTAVAPVVTTTTVFVGSSKKRETKMDDATVRDRWLQSFSNYTTSSTTRAWSSAQVCRALRIRLQLLVNEQKSNCILQLDCVVSCRYQ
jgi:hypothetical protein